MQSSPFLNKNLLLLIACQGLFLTNNVTFIAINGLVGLGLTPIAWMATLPVMGYVVGSALSTSLVSKAQTLFGRRRSFQLGLAVAIFSSLICAYAAWSKNFWLLTTGTLIAGFYSANAQLYRFAATELTTEEHKEKAISWVLAGGILGAVIGPNLASWTKNVLPVPFVGAYITLTLVGLIGIVLMQFIRFPVEVSNPAGAQTQRPIQDIISQPIFIVSAICASLGYGIMNLLMAATPLAMEVCGHPFSSTALVLEFHVISMFAPGFFTGSLIKRFGKVNIMVTGLLLNFLCVAIALNGEDLSHFLGALICLGVGWNFLFTGATTMAMSTYRPEEKNKAQAAINFFVFSTMALTSFGSGALVTTQGWSLLNAWSLILLIVIGLSLGFLVFRLKYKD
ncbi:MAG: MFS transporter [Betaproteobacteria bacterium]|jgi:MFS family permease